ncbi:unnamed protein product [Lactuca saligna]|uniref:Uncharacterized protein n=1 Tax=Lactuca saligna TaxID=75948 RepID=A0AA35V4Q6_LACSI|nr:unnamed protein product [Lactuca saligna]
MVPRVFRELSPSSFNPRVVSIGPLHREDKKLQEFERYKASCVHDLLHRLDTPTEETLQACVRKVNDLIDRIRACYAGMMSTYGDVDLAKMMVMDGCFILEFIYNFSEGRQIMGNMLLEQPVLFDLFILENQIPFFVLNDIYQCTIFKLGSNEASLSKFILPVLDFIDIYSGSGSSNNIIAELDMAGVKFEPNRNAKWSMAMEVKFRRFPWLFWFWAMDMLVNTQKDVATLPTVENIG